jgi:hypothetical protein
MRAATTCDYVSLEQTVNILIEISTGRCRAARVIQGFPVSRGCAIKGPRDENVEAYSRIIYKQRCFERPFEKNRSKVDLRDASVERTSIRQSNPLVNCVAGTQSRINIDRRVGGNGSILQRTINRRRRRRRR